MSDVSVVFPEPLAPAIIVSRGLVTARGQWGLLCRSVSLTLGENFLQALSIGRNTCSRGLGPLLGDLNPIYSHGFRILRHI